MRNEAIKEAIRRHHFVKNEGLKPVHVLICDDPVEFLHKMKKAAAGLSVIKGRWDKFWHGGVKQDAGRNSQRSGSCGGRGARTAASSTLFKPSQRRDLMPAISRLLPRLVPDHCDGRSVNDGYSTLSHPSSGR